MTERERSLRQRRIDAGKTAGERNRDGQFATPYRLAEEIVGLVRQLRAGGRPPDFLEPCIGTGAFYSAVRAAFPTLSRAVGIEKDPEFAEAASELWGGAGLELIRGDFTRQPSPGRRFDLLVTNPPYVRHHHLSIDEKARLRGAVARKTGIELSGLSGLYGYFLLFAHDWLAEGGLSAWLIPAEFLDVNYGLGIKAYLTTRVNLLRIHRFLPADVQFADAMVSSAVVVFENAEPSGRPVTFSQGGRPTAPESSIEVARPALAPEEKWARLFSPPAIGPTPAGPTFGDLFTIKRGIATGNNGFFILPESRARDLGLPGEFLRPILPPARGLAGDVVASRPDGAADLPRPLVLIDCPLEAGRVRREYPRFWEYLGRGIEAKVHEGYLASRRSPWYSQEARPSPPFLCTYMGRIRPDGGGPFRFIWNRSRATAPNVYLLLYPRGALEAALARRPDLAGRVFEALRTIDGRRMIEGARVYGGGLHKVEPKELAGWPAGSLIRALDGAAGALP